MSAQVRITIQIGPMVAIEVEGDNCAEITEALEGWEGMNSQVDRLCTDLAERVYPPDHGEGAKPNSKEM